LTVGSHEAGWVLDPAVNQFLQPTLGQVVQHAGPAQGMEIPVRVEPQLGGSMMAIGQGLAGITQGLEVADRVGMLE
jgi:hypothetical protein